MTEENVFSIMEKRDEDQILAEIKGEVIQDYFYEAKGGKVVISWLGIRELARQYGKVETFLVDIKETDSSWIVIIKATDLEKGHSLLGTSVQPKIDQYSKTGELDEFSYQKAFSKAQRNALKIVLPEALFAKAIESYRKDGKKGTSQTERQRHQVPSKVNVTDYMKPVELKPPSWNPADELNRTPDAWDTADNIIGAWMQESGFNMEDFTIKARKKVITVVPNKTIQPNDRPAIEGVMLGGGFLPAKILKVAGWRLNKSDVVD